MVRQSPMLTEQSELETNRTSHAIYGETAIRRLNGRSTKVVLLGVTVEFNRGTTEGIIGVCTHVFFPTDFGPAVITEEMYQPT